MVVVAGGASEQSVAFGKALAAHEHDAPEFVHSGLNQARDGI